MFKIAQVAKRLNCSISTIYELIKAKKLEHYRCPGIRVTEEHLRQYLESVQQGGRSRRPASPRRRSILKHIRLA